MLGLRFSLLQMYICRCGFLTVRLNGGKSKKHMMKQSRRSVGSKHYIEFGQFVRKPWFFVTNPRFFSMITAKPRVLVCTRQICRVWKLRVYIIIIYTCPHTHIHIHIYICICICICTCTCTCTYVYCTYWSWYCCSLIPSRPSRMV